MSKFIELIEQIQGDRTQAELAHIMGVSEATISLAKRGERQREPEKGFIAALLRVAEPEQQRDLLLALGMDVAQFEAAILASAGVVVVAPAKVGDDDGFNFERTDDFFETWTPITRVEAEAELAAYYPRYKEVISLLETSAQHNALEPSGVIYTDVAAYRVTVTATVGGNGKE